MSTTASTITKHTPTPWRLGNKTGMGSVVADEPVPEIGGSDAVDYYGGHLIAESIAPRNAAFIVHACNSHDQLLAALREANELLKQNDIDLNNTTEYESGRACDIVARIHSALAAGGAA